MREVVWGIIGCGDVTEVKSGPAFNKVPHSRLGAVMRRDAVKAADYARRHGVPRWYADADQLIGDPDVNAIYIATPPDSHLHYARKALQKGKAVYVEKPVTRDSKEAADLMEITGEQLLSVAHYRRRQPLFLQVKEWLDQGRIGRPQRIELRFTQPYLPKPGVNWRLDPQIAGGGLFHALAPHQLDLMRYFLGPAVRATGISGNTGGAYEADDTVSGQILFPGGVLFSGYWCFTDREKKDQCRILGSEGSIEFPVFDHRTLLLTERDRSTEWLFEPLPHVQQPMIEAVVRYFRGEADNPCPAAAAVDVMRMIDAFTRP